MTFEEQYNKALDDLMDTETEDYDHYISSHSDTITQIYKML